MIIMINFTHLATCLIHIMTHSISKGVNSMHVLDSPDPLSTWDRRVWLARLSEDHCCIASSEPSEVPSYSCSAEIVWFMGASFPLLLNVRCWPFNMTPALRVFIIKNVKKLNGPLSSREVTFWLLDSTCPTRSIFATCKMIVARSTFLTLGCCLLR